MILPVTREQTAIYQRPEALLQNLIRFDTTNPPGNEEACITYVNKLLTEAGFETILLARDPARPNLVTRLTGQGQAPPLLLYGHVDVVTTANQVWQHPPFEGKLVDGYIWGRGALDMKGGVAMMLAALLRAKAEKLALPGDVILALVSDEEAGGDYGARYLVESHAALFEGVRYAIGEFGGFAFHAEGRRFYPLMVTEKQICWLKVTLRGPGGHGSLPVRGGTMAKLARLLQQVDRRRLPVHITPVTRQMIETMASALPFSMSLVLRQLLNPRLTSTILNLLGQRAELLDPLLHHTISATVVGGGDKINVIPSEITLKLDGRLLPGYRPADLLAEVRQIVGDEVELELIRHDPGPAEPDMGWFDTLAGILREADPEGVPMPLIVNGVTDARFFSRLGIQTYGFTPMNLPPGFPFWRTIHAADERIPVEAIAFGTEAIFKALQRFGRE
jgi:acetylornithine deacetylase/succinyl-diaminopimelate desuccinylase-like protein